METANFERFQENAHRRLQAGFATIAADYFGDELVEIGRAIGGTELSAGAAYTRAVGCDCFCGRCRGYAKCSYRKPRHIGDVFSNVFRTGAKSGKLFADASAHFTSHSEDDVVLDLGIGAGTCMAGWELGRSDLGRGPRLGIEVEPNALRVAHTVHGTLISASDISTLPIPAGGRLVVLSGLVFNEVGHAVADSWARAIAEARDDFFWVDVSYRSFQLQRHSRPDDTFEKLGFRKMENFFEGTLDAFGGFGDYRCEGMRWIR